MNKDSEFNILVVDDDEANLYILNRILKKEHTVYVSKSGKNALKRIRENKPDLILLDVVMPDLSGFEVLKIIKGSEDTRSIPVIIITGLDSRKDEQEAFQLGAVDYITKPFHSSIVRARIETHLRIVKQIRTIERFGFIDALTGIPNRRSFDHQMDLEWRRAIREKNPISLLMVDIDDFKDYNDVYGHPQGDALLIGIAKTFVSTLKRKTDLVFRWGGEEFMVILPNTDVIDAVAAAEDVRANVEDTWIPCVESGHPTSVTVSIGVCGKKPKNDDSVEDFIVETDHALYMAKEAGKNKVFFK